MEEKACRRWTAGWIGVSSKNHNSMPLVNTRRTACIDVLFFLFPSSFRGFHCPADSGVLGGWWFGGSPSSPDSNFLRVVNAFPNRRLSDNTLMTPKIRIAPSCASSPGGTPGTPGSGGLPIRRHSSIGPQERRGSTINLSPPTLARSMIGGSMPNTSSSVPFLLSSSMQSIRSRRPSACLSSSGGSGLLQQLGSGMVRQLSSQQVNNGRAFP
ncbi:unnamed protein product, partial [Nesidiocoris tenuis]